MRRSMNYTTSMLQCNCVVKKFLRFMKPEGTLTRLQKPACLPYPEPVHSNSHPQVLSL
jgi:hypothetical protein